VIPPGGSGMYSVSVTSANETPQTKTAQYSLDDGGFDMSVTFVAVPFQTQFVDHQGNPITELDFGVQNYSSATADAMRAVYLKRISSTSTAQAEGVKVQASSSNGDTNGFHIRTEGILADSAVERIPVYITSRPPVYGTLGQAMIVANHGVAPLLVKANWIWSEDQEGNTQGSPVPLYGTVNTPYGEFPTSDPNLIGKYVSNPSWSGSAGGSVVTGG
jgi:hypothetical protein